VAKARHPHNSKRPPSAAVQRAIAGEDIRELYNSLTVRQRAFAEEYVVDFNKSAAALRAGYSKSYVDRQGYLLFKHPGIAAYIRHLMSSKEAKITSIDPDYVIARITQIVGKEDAKDSDKLRGLELLARHLGMFIERQEITGKDGGPIETRETQDAADDLARSIASLAERARAERVDGETLN
jgi:phage FluMu protein gp41